MLQDVPKHVIDAIIFGNPCSRDHKIMQIENYLDRLLPKLKQFTPPPNTSDATRSEINTLSNLLRTPRDVANNTYDENLTLYIKQVFINAGAEDEEIQNIMNDVADDVLPLVTKLKFHFQRPRPATLAYYMGIELYPDFSYFTNSPSYPSCHSTLTAVTCEVLGNLFPESYNTVKKILVEVKNSRMFLGVHYSSDNDMAMVVAQEILKNPEFKLKHKL